MENHTVNPLGELQIELPEDVAQGSYANLAVIAHSAYDFVIDFIRVLPGMPKATVQSRIILTPDNARRLMLALEDNIRKFDEMERNGADYNKMLPPMSSPSGEA
ncbi:MAG: DUF3467 domain-containing protein [Tannerellaceae bacterium]|jgi:hypothetical protein|nr:DUF3467 domain-containing protein [Tannerellaceae bacterium]